MKKLFYFAALILCTFTGYSCSQKQNSTGIAQLRQNFNSPSGTARPKVYWWWLNGYTDRGRIKEELQAIKDAGLGGVDIFEIGFRPDGVVPAGPAFMSDSSLDHITLAIREATRLGLEVGLNLSSSWNAGGAWIKPEHAAKTLYTSKVIVNSADGNKIKLPFPDIPKKDGRGNQLLIEFREDGRPVFSREVAVLAIPLLSNGQLPDTSSILNLTSDFNPETELLTWSIPPGKWEIHRYVCSNTGEHLHLPSPNSYGATLDHFDAEATETHFRYFADKLKSQLGDFSKTALKNFYLASFEVRGTVWTGTMASEFKRLNGYDLYKFLPVLFGKGLFAGDQERKFRQDLNFTVSELMINNHYKKGREIANSYGLNLISESGGPGPPLHNVPVEAIKALGALDIPRGEFWINHSRFDNSSDSIDLLMLVKEIAAASNIYKRKITELEAFTSFQNWQEGPGDMKPIGDRAFCEGMSRAVIHGFTHNPPGMGHPGIGYYAGTHFNDRTTWWPKVKPFNDYLARVSYILQETDFVADVVYYYGDQTPNFATPKNTRFAVGSGYDYEIINTEILLSDLKYENGSLQLGSGAKFRILAVDSLTGRNPAIRQKIDELRSKGAIVTDHRLPSLTATLKAQNLLPDFDYPDKGSKRLDYMKADQPVLDYIHHKLGDYDFYFVRNTRNEWISRACKFRQPGKSPEIWDAVNGEISGIPVYNQLEGQVEVPLTFPPYGSFFVVFGPDGTSQLKPANNAANASSELLIGGSWNINFPEGWGAPRNITFTDLVSWTGSDIPGVKYFSGTAVYDKSFSNTLEAGESERIYLDLGRVARVADVWLNGQHLGITWTPPYRYDVTGIVQPGENQLKIEIVNTWSNRIIGDLTSEVKYTSTNLKERGSRELTWAETPLLESGLLGPVRLQTVKVTP